MSCQESPKKYYLHNHDCRHYTTKYVSCQESPKKHYLFNHGYWHYTTKLIVFEVEHVAEIDFAVEPGFTIYNVISISDTSSDDERERVFE